MHTSAHESTKTAWIIGYNARNGTGYQLPRISRDSDTGHDGIGCHVPSPATPSPTGSVSTAYRVPVPRRLSLHTH